MKYAGQSTKEISFPLGGIETGCIGLAGGDRLGWLGRYIRQGTGRYGTF